jgi:transcriptional regulator with XRE-family HTH domain/tetratricopeptide (TPR) repeat protein
MDRLGYSFSTLLRTYRAAANFTQEELAERSGLTAQAISALETGRRRAPRSSTITFLADAMHLDEERRRALIVAARGGAEDTSPVPMLLPRSIADFTGRSAEVDLMRGVLAPDQPAATPVAVVTGAPGMGKSTLALHVAHLLRERFPDGQLFVDLRGAEARPLPAADVLASFLRVLGMDGSAIPDELEVRLAQYRTRLAGRRILVVLDNAVDEAQVRPLLPSVATGAAIVTSRAPLGGLEAVSHLPLGGFSRAAALDLLARVAGRRRIEAELRAAGDVVELCGGLPLALRIAGARLAARVELPVGSYARRLADERRRLDELQVGDIGVRASLALSYDALDPETRSCFRLLGLLDAPDFPAWLVAGLLDRGVAHAETLLERLADARLLETPTEDGAGQTRYRLHSLLQLFAQELVAQDDAELRRAALERALGAQLALAEQAQWALQPETAREVARGDAPRWRPPEPGLVEGIENDPITWFEAERESLVAGVARAARAGLHETAWELAASMHGFLTIRGHWQDAYAVHGMAVEAASKAGDRRGLMQASLLLGSAHLWVGDTDRASSCLDSAMTLARALNDTWREAISLAGLVFASLDRGELDAAIDRAERALTLHRSAGDAHGEGVVLYGLGMALREKGRLGDAVEALRSARPIFIETGNRLMLGQIDVGLASVHRSAGRPGEAEAYFVQAIEQFEELGNRLLVAQAQHAFVTARLDRKVNVETIALLQECIGEFRELGLRDAEAQARQQLELIRGSA